MNYILILYNPCVKWIPCTESKGTYLAEMKKRMLTIVSWREALQFPNQVEIDSIFKGQV